MKKKIYTRPLTEFVKVEVQSHLLAGGSKTGNGGTIIGGGTNGNANKEEGGEGSGGDNDFPGDLGSKKFNAWANWDD